MISARYYLLVIASAVGARAAASPCPAGPVFPHVVDGGGFKSSLYLVNNSAAIADFTLTFRDDAGKPKIFKFADGRVDDARAGSIPGGGTIVLETASDAASGLADGSAALKATPANAISGFLIVRERLNGADFEASAPMATTAPAWSSPFDNSAGFGTGLAVAASCEGEVKVTATGERGETLGTATVKLAAGGHKSFLLAELISATDGKRGVVKLAGSAGQLIGGVGLRFSPAGAIASYPPLPEMKAAASAPRTVHRPAAKK